MGKNDDPTLPQLASVASARELADDAAHGLARRMPSLSAHQVITGKQAAALFIAFFAFTAFAILAPPEARTIAAVTFAVAFVAGTLFRAALAVIGGAPTGDTPAGEIDLPVYTILVPLYGEADVLPRLARALLLLDYPRDKLDIKLIVEEDDLETSAVADALANRGPFDIIRVPFIQPRTKPKACNFALPCVLFLSEFREAA